jgi:hypothetical protein
MKASSFGEIIALKMCHVSVFMQEQFLSPTTTIISLKIAIRESIH